jgi:pimeloyl-ACP methyl ester carboxylesterase
VQSSPPLTLDEARRAEGALTAALSEGATAYHVAGESGPWVVLVHGLLTPMFAWEPLSATLAGQGFRVLRYDQLGRGLSDRPSLRYEPALYVRQLRELSALLGIERMHLVSWSMGAVIASRFAAIEPARVASLTLIAPALFLSPPAKLRLLLSFALGQRWIMGAIGDSLGALPRQHLVHPERFPNYGARARQQLCSPGVAESFLSTLQNFAWNEGVKFAQTAPPTLIVWGESDRTTPFKNAAAVQAQFPGARLLRVPGARHGVHLDHAHVVEPELLAFLRAHAA